MIEAAVLLLVILAGTWLLRTVLVQASLERERLLASFERERDDWAKERQTLLERIQRPEARPALSLDGPAIEPFDPQEMDLAIVGTVVSGESDDAG